ncbi:MAG: hypothetical protein K6C10_03890 [Prevotella sp.]|nr:hypothetical protein [Prevotella sp.]
MKAVYQKPLTEVVEYKNEKFFMIQSYDHADSKGYPMGGSGGGGMVITNGQMEDSSPNIWED